jgi:hypothetical protein
MMIEAVIYGATPKHHEREVRKPATGEEVEETKELVVTKEKLRAVQH